MITDGRAAVGCFFFFFERLVRESYHVADDAGPLLARAGLIANEQLLQARQAQASHGGTLGEHLVLAAFIDDDELTSFYRSRLMVPRVDPRQLQNVPARVIARIPKDMAAEFRLVPIAIDREQNLILAMSDPSNTHAVDEIGFFTGAYVVRAVANQREIAEALDRYYGIHTPLLTLAQAPTPPPQDALDAGSERRNVLPPMGSPPALGRAVRISEIVPALREAKDSEALAQASGRLPAQPAPAVSSPNARTAVPGDRVAQQPIASHEQLTQQPQPRYGPEDDTRPIARVSDLLPLREPQRVSREASIATAGEISAPLPDAHQSEKLEAVIIADDQLARPPEQPVLLTRKRQSSAPSAPVSQPATEDVVLLSKRKTARGRSPATTRMGMGGLGAAQPKTPPTAPPTADAEAKTRELAAVQGTPPTPAKDVADVDEAPAPSAASPNAVYDASVRRLATAMKTLAAASSRDAVISTLVEYMGASCRRAAFFTATKGSLRGWLAVGEGVVKQNIDTQLTLDKPSTFQDIVATRLPFHGPVHDQTTRDFLLAVVGAAPVDMTALPVSICDKVIGIAYGDDRKHPMFDEHLNSLVRCAGEALERIVLKRKTTAPV